MPALNQLAQKSHNGKRYDQWVHLVHVYVIEAHPKAPDLSPYSGTVWEMAYSSKAQPTNYPARVQNAKSAEALLQGDQLLLVDDLNPGVAVNPAWCSYGPCPNCSFLIGQDGKLVQVLTKTPNKLATLESEIQALVP